MTFGDNLEKHVYINEHGAQITLYTVCLIRAGRND